MFLHYGIKYCPPASAGNKDQKLIGWFIRWVGYFHGCPAGKFGRSKYILINQMLENGQ